MSRITSVEPQKKNPKRFNVFLDGQFAFGADEDLVIDKRLIVGKQINPEELEKLLFEAEVGKLMERMYSLFNIRSRSEKEVRDYLKNLSFKRKIKDQEEISQVSIDMVVEKLKHKRLLDDKQFALSWFASRSKKKGIQVIKGELFKKGISKEIIDSVVETGQDTNSQEIVAEKLLEKRLERFKNLSALDKKKKAYDFLMRRGFDYDLVKELVEKFIKK